MQTTFMFSDSGDGSHLRKFIEEISHDFGVVVVSLGGHSESYWKWKYALKQNNFETSEKKLCQGKMFSSPRLRTKMNMQ